MDAKESVINSSEQLVIVSHSLPTGSPLRYLGKQRARKNWGEVKRRGGRGAGGEERRSFHLSSPRPPPPRLFRLAPVSRARCYQNQAESLWTRYVSQGAILWENFRSRLVGLLQLYLSVSLSLGTIPLLVYLLGQVLCEVDGQTVRVFIVSLKFFFPGGHAALANDLFLRMADSVWTNSRERAQSENRKRVPKPGEAQATIRQRGQEKPVRILWSLGTEIVSLQIHRSCFNVVTISQTSAASAD